MPETDQEVFDHFRNVAGDKGREIAYLAYARYAQAKYDWVNKRQARTGQVATTAEVTEWIASLPNSALDDYHDGAIRTFQAAAEDYLKSRVAEERAQAVQASILDQVQRATSFWRTVLAGVVSTGFFTLIVIGGVVVYKLDPSVFGLIKSVSAPGR